MYAVTVQEVISVDLTLLRQLWLKQSDDC